MHLLSLHCHHSTALLHLQMLDMQSVLDEVPRHSNAGLLIAVATGGWSLMIVINIIFIIFIIIHFAIIVCRLDMNEMAIINFLFFIYDLC